MSKIIITVMAVITITLMGVAGVFGAAAELLSGSGSRSFDMHAALPPSAPDKRRERSREPPP